MRMALSSNAAVCMPCPGAVGVTDAKSEAGNSSLTVTFIFDISGRTSITALAIGGHSA